MSKNLEKLDFFKNYFTMDNLVNYICREFNPLLWILGTYNLLSYDFTNNDFKGFITSKLH